MFNKLTDYVFTYLAIKLNKSGYCFGINHKRSKKSAVSEKI